nr:N-acetylmuramoyl-L-alanine amidase [Niabella hibiscisoli]
MFTFSISRTQTSAHYVVGRDGVVYQMLNDYVRAWHAGTANGAALPI